MLTDILLKGAIRLAGAHIFNSACGIIIRNNYIDDVAELNYGYKIKKKKPLTKKLSKLENLLYFVPILGTVLLAFDVLIIGGSTIFLCATNKSGEFRKKLIKEAEKTYEMPEERLKKLQNGQNMHKNIVDSLKIDGLDKKEIEEFIKEAKKEEVYLNSDNSKEINANMQRVENLRLLSPVKDMLKHPEKAYKYTLNKKIQYANVDDDTLTIGVSKLGKNVSDEEKPKIYTKEFKLRQR